jgi:hypothetical protein
VVGRRARSAQGWCGKVGAGLNFWLFGKTASQLDSFHVRLDRTQMFLLANSVCTNIKGDLQDRVRGQIVISMISGRNDFASVGVDGLSDPPPAVDPNQEAGSNADSSSQ